MKTLYKIFISIILAFMYLLGNAQMPYKNITINSETSGTRDFRATQSISLAPGAKYNGTSGRYFAANIDKNLSYKFKYEDSGIITNRPHRKSFPVGSTPGSFAVSPLGAATYSIPIQTSPGTGGLEPKINISYNSRSSNGIFGLGWNLTGLSAITRVGKSFYYDNEMDAVKLDDTDNFAIDGQRLIEQSGAIEGCTKYYHTEMTDFSKIMAYDTEGSGYSPEYFIVRTKDNKLLYYGNYGNSNAYLKSDDSDRIIAWYIARIEDKLGNYIVFNYEQNTANGETWITDIQYTGNKHSGLDPYNKIEFVYTDKQDISTSHIAGCKLTQSKLAYKIITYAEDEMVRKYILTYHFDVFTKLNEIYECNENWDYYNTIAVKWGNKSNNIITDGGDLYGPTSGVAYFADFNGDGYIDYFEMKKNQHNPDETLWWYNEGEMYGGWTEITSGSYIGRHFEVSPADCDGDGKSELIVDKENLEYYSEFEVWSLNGTSFTKSELDISSNQSGRKFIVGDFDGDAQDELAIYNNSYQIFDFDGDYSNTPTKTSTGIWSNEAEFNSYATDLNHDGRDDIVIQSETQLRITSVNDRSLLDLFFHESTNTYLGDFNGDGYMDYLEWNEFTGWEYTLLKEGHFFSRISISQIPDIDTEEEKDNDNIFIRDIDADGKDEIILAQYNDDTDNCSFSIYHINNNVVTVQNQNLSSIQPHKYYYRGFMDINGDGYEDCYLGNVLFFNDGSEEKLVTNITDGNNYSVDINYNTLPNMWKYKKEANAVFPIVDLNFPLFVVEGVTTKANGTTIGKKDYEYEGAKAHVQGKGFIGFSKVTSIDPLNKITAVVDYDILTNNNSGYHPYLKTSSTTINSTLVKSQNNQMELVVNADKTYWPRILSFEENDHLNDITKQHNYISYDTDGNVLILEKNSFIGGGTLERKVRIENNYYIGIYYYDNRLASTKVTTTRPGQQANIHTTGYVYTDNDLVALEIINSGTDFELVENYTYDAAGNITQHTKQDALNTTIWQNEYSYDSKFRYLISKTNGLGDQVLFTKEPKFGNTISESNASGEITTFKYDHFGNLIQIQTPSLTTEFTREWYSGSNVPGAFYRVKSNSTDGNFKYEYYNASRKLIHTTKRGFNGAEIHEKLAYNLLGKLISESKPYKTGESIQNYITSYDNFHRKSSIVGPGVNLQFSYSPRTTTVNDNLGNSNSVKIYNSLGEVIEARDNGGVIKYVYNAIGKPVKVTSPGSTVTMEYDILGNKIGINDPNAGPITFEYDLLRNNTKRTDAKGNTYIYEYDILGRKIKEINADEGTTTYNYVTSGFGLGKISSISNSKTGISKSYKYNNKDNLISETEIIEGTSYTYNYGYDKFERVAIMTYPSGYQIKYLYEENGPELIGINNSSDEKIWEVTDKNALDQLLQIEYGNGLTTDYSYNSINLPIEIKTHNGINNIQWLQFGWNNSTKNLNWRKDNLVGQSGIQEDFTYDNLNRLKSYQVEQQKLYTMNYYSDGKFESKTDVGKYTFGENGSGPHAVTSVNLSDDNSLNDNSISYTSFNKIENIEENNSSTSFIYGLNQERKITLLNENETLKKKKVYVGNFYEIEEDFDGKKRYLHYIPGPKGEIAILTKEDSEEDEINYIHKDYLGSYQTISDNHGNAIEILNFDPWGRRRNAQNWTYNNVSDNHKFDRGYTGHEHMDNYSLINMNGRIYDPYLAVFLGPDNYISDPFNSQSFNRYSYVNNNPFVFSDPTGDFPWILVAIVAVVGSYAGGAAAEGWEWDPTKWEWDADTWKGMGIGALIGGASAAGFFCAAPALAKLGVFAYFGQSGMVAAYTIAGTGIFGAGGYAIGYSGGMIYSNGDANYAHQSGLYGAEIGTVFGAIMGLLYGHFDSNVPEEPKKKTRYIDINPSHNDANIILASYNVDGEPAITGFVERKYNLSDSYTRWVNGFGINGNFDVFASAHVYAKNGSYYCVVSASGRTALSVRNPVRWYGEVQYYEGNKLIGSFSLKKSGDVLSGDGKTFIGKSEIRFPTNNLGKDISLVLKVGYYFRTNGGHISPRAGEKEIELERTE